MGLLDRLGLTRLKEGLAKTRDSLVASVTRIVATRTTIDDDVLNEVEEALIAGDVGVDASTAIIEAIRARVKQDRYATAAELQTLLRDEIRRQFPVHGDSGADPFALPASRPHVVMVVGINGVGKTTTIGKLAHVWVQRGAKVVIAAADTFRAAANEQLEIWAARAGAEIIRQEHGADPAAVAFDALRSAISRKADVVIVDTAGRLHTRVNLMEELKKIGRVLGKQLPGAPHEVLLVIDASTGQNGMQQARQFGAASGVTGLVVTKLDGTAKGGIVLAIARTLNLPVKFIGVGERLDDLQPFDGAAFVDALFEA
jgi:fused signal recognition particle receptor